MRRLAILLAATLLSTIACDGCGAPVPGPGDTGPKGRRPGGLPPLVETDPTPEPEPERARVLLLEPADATLVARVGGSETLRLSAVIAYEDGERRPAEHAFFASLNPEIGTLDQTGLFTPSRERAGTARVRTRAEGLEAVTTVRVVLNEELSLGGGVDGSHFEGSLEPAPGPRVLYPENGVVIPANLAPLLFQWDKARTSARVLLEGEQGSLALYTNGDRVEAPASAWRRFLVAHVGRSFSVHFDESNGPGSERVRTSLTIHLANADLRSTVYYWAVDRGRVVRIDADSLAPIVLDIPYEDVPEGGHQGFGEVQCRACHALSANGQRMAFTYFGGDGPGGVVDTAQLTPVVPNRSNRRWNFAAISPTGSLLLANFQQRLTLRDGETGDVIPGQEDVTGFDAAHPAFSPTGDAVAYAGNLERNPGVYNWEIDFNRSNLYVASVDPIARTVGAPRQIVPGQGEALYYPSFSPDGRLVAYTKGPHSRSRWGGNVRGELFLAAAHAPAGGDGVPRTELVRANPGRNSYLPTFNPKVEGGYLWIAFYSRRDYGHVTRGQERPQIWVAAVDASADPAGAAADPSHPAFWLPGQNHQTDNLSSFFAPRPCSSAGGSCDSDAACCGSLLCRPAGDQHVCVPPEEACGLTGDSCGSDEACCDGLLCAAPPTGGAPVCLPPGTVCSERGQRCELDADCCEGAGLCLDDGEGATRCLTKDDLPCAVVGTSCNDRPCCEGHGECYADTCIILDG